MNRTSRENESTPKDMNIVLWGPPQSGKRWLLWSFARELSVYNQGKQDFLYELFAKYPGEADRLFPLRVEEPDLHLSDLPIDYNWVFRRSPLLKDQAHQRSAFTHMMNISVIPGFNSVECLFNPWIDDTSAAMLRQAQHVIVTLSPDRLASTVDGTGFKMEKEGLSERACWTQEEYLTVVHELLEQITKKNPKTHSVVFCITKMDLVKERGTAWEILSKLFGGQMVKLLRYFSTEIALEVFATTAFGMNLLAPEAALPLGTDGRGTWFPINTIAPFFFIFQYTELVALRNRAGWESVFQSFRDKGINKNYIPYNLHEWNQSI